MGKKADKRRGQNTRKWHRDPEGMFAKWLDGPSGADDMSHAEVIGAAFQDWLRYEMESDPVVETGYGKSVYRWSGLTYAERSILEQKHYHQFLTWIDIVIRRWNDDSRP